MRNIWRPEDDRNGSYYITWLNHSRYGLRVQGLDLEDYFVKEGIISSILYIYIFNKFNLGIIADGFGINTAIKKIYNFQ